MKVKKEFLLISIFTLGLIFSLYLFSYQLQSVQVNPVTPSIKNQKELPEFSLNELLLYNGTNPDLPIYLAYHGLVYDVTPGSKFYKEGASYHFLAGKDATEDLDIAGGAIVKRKYAVIGKLIEVKQ